MEQVTKSIAQVAWEKQITVEETYDLLNVTDRTAYPLDVLELADIVVQHMD
jgi:hypothetical protein